MSPRRLVQRSLTNAQLPLPEVERSRSKSPTVASVSAAQKQLSPYFETTSRLSRKITAPPSLGMMKEIADAAKREKTTFEDEYQLMQSQLHKHSPPPPVQSGEVETDPDGSCSSCSSSRVPSLSLAEELERLATLPLEKTDSTTTTNRKPATMEITLHSADETAQQLRVAVKSHSVIPEVAQLAAAVTTLADATAPTAPTRSTVAAPASPHLGLSRTASTTMRMSKAVASSMALSGDQATTFLREMAREHEVAQLFEELRAVSIERHEQLVQHIRLISSVQQSLLQLAECDELSSQEVARAHPDQPRPTSPRDPAAAKYDHRRLFAAGRERDPFVVFNDVLVANSARVRECEEQYKENKLSARVRARLRRSSHNNAPITSLDELGELLRVSRRQAHFQTEVIRIHGELGKRAAEYESVVNARLLPGTTTAAARRPSAGESPTMTPRSRSRDTDCKEALRECITHMAPYAVLDSSITSLHEFVELGAFGNRAFLDVGRDLLRAFVICQQLRSPLSFAERHAAQLSDREPAPVNYQAASNLFGLVLAHCGDWLVDYFSDGDHEKLLPLWWKLVDVEHNTRIESTEYVQTIDKLQKEAPLVLIGLLSFINAQHLVKSVQESIYTFTIAALDRKAGAPTNRVASVGDRAAAVATPATRRRK